MMSHRIVKRPHETRFPASTTASCQSSMEDFLAHSDDQLMSWQDLVEKGVLSQKDLKRIKSDPHWQSLIQGYASSVEEERYGQAVIGVLQKKYPALTKDQLTEHYKALMAFECS